MNIVLDDDLLLESFLNKRLFNTRQNEIWQGRIELIIRPECNQKCDYCYITQHGEDLYPQKYRANNQVLLHNLELLLKYFDEKNFICPRWELFAGDLFYDDLYFDILDLFFKYYKKFINIQDKLIYPKDKKARVNSNFITSISIPFNGSVFHNKEKVKKIENYIQKAFELKIWLGFSWSHDGPYSTEVREKREIDEEYYNTAFEFIKKYHYGAHPMISFEGIDSMIDNYNWWLEQYEKHISYNQEGVKELIPMFLEVRNDGWTEEKIQKYLEFLDYAVNHRFYNVCEGDVEKMAYHLFVTHQPENFKRYSKMPKYDLCSDFLWIKNNLNNDNEKRCSLGHSYCINLAKLSLVPCHRLTYEFFEAGNFITNEVLIEDINKNNYLKEKLENSLKNTKIIGIKASQGLSAYMNILNSNPSFYPKCNVCDFRNICINGCLGAQYEVFGEWSTPIPSVCNLLKSKYTFLINKYEELGIFDYMFNSPNFPISLEFKNNIEFILNKIKAEKRK